MSKFFFRLSSVYQIIQTQCHCNTFKVSKMETHFFGILFILLYFCRLFYVKILDINFKRLTYCRSMLADPIAPILAKKHYPAMERRLNNIMKYLDECISKMPNGVKDVILVEYHNPVSFFTSFLLYGKRNTP